MNSFIESKQMKRTILLILAPLLISSATMAQLPPIGYIGLFVDDQHHSWAICDFEGPYVAKAEMWIWCLPSERGQIGADFALMYPQSTLIPSTVTANDYIIAIVTGDLENGISVLYNECQYDWNWCFHQSIYITSHQPAMIEIIEHPGLDPPIYNFRSCEEGWPIEPAIKFTNWYFNYYYYPGTCIPPIGTDDSSWGAIKSIYRKW